MKHVLCVLLLLFSTNLFSQQTQKLIAVNDLKGKGVSDDEISLISNRLRTELFKTGQFRVMERSEMVAIAEEQEFQKSEFCQESECAVDFGRMLGVSSIVTGTIGKIDSFVTISVQMISVETGEVISVADYDYNGTVSGLIATGLQEITGELISRNISVKKVAVEIHSQPDSVMLLFNKTISGVTPFRDSLPTGNYSVEISKKGFVTKSEKVNLTAGQPFTKTVTLSPKNRRLKSITKIISGVVTTGAVTLGMISNSKYEQDVTDANDLYLLAKQTGTGPALNNEYVSHTEHAGSMKMTRNLSYAVAGVAASLFTVSFFF